MGRAINNQAASLAGAASLSWFALIARAIRGERALISTHDAAQTLGRAAAEKRRRSELTQRERYDDFHARRRRERDAGLFRRAR